MDTAENLLYRAACADLAIGAGTDRDEFWWHGDSVKARLFRAIAKLELPKHPRSAVASGADATGACYGLTWGRARKPYIGNSEGLSNVLALIRETLPDEYINWPYTSVQFNRTLRSQLHVDSSSAGKSLVITLGPFVAGWTWTMTRNRQQLLPQFEWAALDGSQPHMSTPFAGDRVSVVLFVHAAAMAPAAIPLLRQAAALGLNIPAQLGNVKTSVTQDVPRALENAESEYSRTCLELLENLQDYNLDQLMEAMDAGRLTGVAEELSAVISKGASAIWDPQPRCATTTCCRSRRA